ncbi:MAG: hypothetical protein P1U58_20510 [Verrucomicrobiales bacterium]|nr:hypothetical protein [Verrucomicrobiales bacterium]
MKLKNTLAFAFLCSALPLSALANPGDGDKDGPKDLEVVFGKLDKNDDGHLGLVEFSKSNRMENKKPEAVAKAFEERDLNSNGELSLREFEKTFHEGKRGAGKGKGKKGGKGKKSGKGGKS